MKEISDPAGETFFQIVTPGATFSWKMRRRRRGRIVIAGTLRKRNEFIGILKPAAPQPFLKSHPAGQFSFEKVNPRVTSSAKE